MSDRSAKSSQWKPSAVCFAICLAAFAVLWIFRQQGGLEFLELKTYDALLRNESRDTSLFSRFLIIAVNDEDIAKYGYPIPDHTLRQLIEKLQEAEPRAIGVDIVRDIPEPPFESRFGAPLPPAWNKELRDFLQDDRNSNVSWSFVPLANDRLKDLAVPAPVKEEQYGAAEVIHDPSDQLIRRALLFSTSIRSGEKKTYASLAYQLAITYLAGETPPIDPKPAPGDLVQLGPEVINKFHPSDGAYIDADERGYQFLLDYRGPRDFEKTSVDDVLTGKVPPAAIHDKIIVVGVTTQSNKDIVSTPVNDGMYGVIFQAISAEQLLRFALRGARPIRSWSDRTEMLWTLGWTLLGGLAGYRVRSPWRWALACAGGLGVLIYSAHVAVNHGVWIPLLPPAMLWMVCAALATSYKSSREKQDRALLMKLFSRQVSGAVAQEIWGNRDELLSEGKLLARELTVTVLFTDLKGFTALAQTMDPAALMEWLNEYMAAMSRTVEKHGGIVNKYMGDALMAIFGAPVPSPAPASARGAVACALEMRTQFGELKLGWKMRGLPDLSMRVGIHTGALVVGTLGGTERAEYTVIGDTVNTAQRIESYNKDVMDSDIAADGCRILIGEATRELLNGQFRLRALGEVQLPGRRELLAIHGVIQ